MPPDLELLTKYRHRWGGAADVVVFASLRNEAQRLPHFLEYHRSIGVSGFVFIDNDSSDASRDVIRDQGDCTLFYTEDSYAASGCGIDWLNQVLTELARDRWILVLDLDELFFYPMVEWTSIQTLTGYLESRNANGMRAFMLDMYAPGSLKSAVYTPPEPFLGACPLYDPGGYEIAQDGFYAGMPVRGGPRRRLFWADDEAPGNPPVLGKCPLLRWSERSRLVASTHVVENVRASSLTGAILHFKFFSALYEHAENEAKRGEHWEQAAQYRAYHQTLRCSPGMVISDGNSKSLRSSDDLIKAGLMCMPGHFLDWVKKSTQKFSANENR